MAIIPITTCPTVMHIEVHNGDLRVSVRVPPSVEMHQSEWYGQTNGYMVTGKSTPTELHTENCVDIFHSFYQQ
jgi:hypothetical protein